VEIKKIGGEKVKLKKKIALTISLITIAIMQALLIPVPIHAKIVEGYGEIPKPIAPIVRSCRFNLSFTLQNTTFTFNIEGEAYVCKAETVELTVTMTDSGDNTTLIHVCLFMRNCQFKTCTVEGYIGYLNLDVDMTVQGSRVYYCCWGTTRMPVYAIIGNVVRSLR